MVKFVYVSVERSIMKDSMRKVEHKVLDELKQKDITNNNRTKNLNSKLDHLRRGKRIKIHWLLSTNFEKHDA